MSYKTLDVRDRTVYFPTIVDVSSIVVRDICRPTQGAHKNMKRAKSWAQTKTLFNNCPNGTNILFLFNFFKFLNPGFTRLLFEKCWELAELQFSKRIINLNMSLTIVVKMLATVENDANSSRKPKEGIQENCMDLFTPRIPNERKVTFY